MKSDIEIAQSVELKPITEVVEKLVSHLMILNSMVNIKQNYHLIKSNLFKKINQVNLSLSQLSTQHQLVKENQQCLSVLLMR